MENIKCNPTCIVTGKQDKLLMHAHRNSAGDMVGWVFIHESVDVSKIPEMEWKSSPLNQASQPSREQVIEVLKDAVVQFNKNADHRLVNNIKESKEGYQATAIIKLFANSRASQEAETMKRNPVSFEQAKQQVERLNQENLSNPWPLKDVLSKLIEAADILLHKKDYDGHGHEEIFIAVQRAKEIRQQVERLNGGGEEPDYGFCKEKGCDKKAVIDYNGCGHYVCQSHYDSLSKYFDEEYK